MTISYQRDVASSTAGGFTRLLFKWKARPVPIPLQRCSKRIKKPFAQISQQMQLRNCFNVKEYHLETASLKVACSHYIDWLARKLY